MKFSDALFSIPLLMVQLAAPLASSLLIQIEAFAEVPTETYGTLTLGEIPPHTVSINTFTDTIIIYNADSDQVLGMLSTGNGANALEVDRNKGVAHVAETYLSRHTRGERTDVITTYDLKTLSATREIVIPPKHATGSPLRHYSGIVRDESDHELMLVTNITPAVSVTVADLISGAFLNEINTAGCGLVYPVDGLRFMQLCGDGTAQLITLNQDGTEKSRSRSKVFFDLLQDPLMEKPVETAEGWVFNTFKGQLYRLSNAAGDIVVEQLFNIEEATNEWRIGGMQPLAYHADQNLLLTLVHPGGKDTHKDPGTEIWYYHIATGQRLHRLVLQSLGTSIQVSQDERPLIYVGSTIMDQLDIYDLKTGNLRGTIGDLGFPTILQNL